MPQPTNVLETFCSVLSSQFVLFHQVLMRTAAFSGFIYLQFVTVRPLKRKSPAVIHLAILKGFLEDFQDVNS